MKVIGMEKKKITSKKDGTVYDVGNIYCTYEAPGVTGVKVEDVFAFVEQIPPELRLGDEIQVFYNRRGRIEKIEVVK